MALCRGPAGQAVLEGELRKIRALELAALDGEGRDHLVVGLRHVARTGGLGDIGVLHLGGVLVDIGDLHAELVERIGDKAGDDRLWRGTRADGVAADHFKVDLGAHAVVLRQHDRKAADHVLHDGKTLLDVVLAVHAELGGAAAGGDDDGLERARGNEGRRVDHRVSRARAEAAHVRAGRIAQAGDLSCRLGKVAAAALVHIAAGLLAAVDHVVDVFLGNAALLDRCEQRQHGGRLGDEVLMHDVGGEVHVDVVRAVDAADQLAVVIKPLGMLLGNEALDLSLLGLRLGDAGHDGLVDQGVRSELAAVGGGKAGFQLDEVEHVAGLHQQQKLLLRHHLAESAVAVADIAGLVAPGLGNGGQLIRGLVADVDLIGPVGENLIERADVVRQLLEVFALGVDDALGRLGGAVVEHHIGCVRQDVAGALDHCFHSVVLPFLCLFQIWFVPMGILWNRPASFC